MDASQIQFLQWTKDISQGNKKLSNKNVTRDQVSL